MCDIRLSEQSCTITGTTFYIIKKKKIIENEKVTISKTFNENDSSKIETKLYICMYYIRSPLLWIYFTVNCLISH